MYSTLKQAGHLHSIFAPAAAKPPTVARFCRSPSSWQQNRTQVVAAAAGSLPACMGVLHGDIEKVLYNQDVIAEAVSQLGKQLAQDYAEKTPLVLGTLCGAFVFMADLVRCIDPVPRGLEMDFLRISSYVGTQSSGNNTMAMQPRLPVKGRHVLVVEDIVDTGRTLKALISHLEQQGAASVKIVTLLNKQARRVMEIQADYVGFQGCALFILRLPGSSASTWHISMRYASNRSNCIHVKSMRVEAEL
ncbi:hypothetical protein ABBQ32_000613 [Trebouxia sp. C0010 RCD-2024]